MKVWSFLFTDPKVFAGISGPILQSARVLAPNKQWAATILSNAVGFDVESSNGVICQYAGELSGNIGVTRLVERGGRVHEAS